MKKYQHLFFDLDHTLWDTDANNAQTVKDLLLELNQKHSLNLSFETFFPVYYAHNKKLWEMYHQGLTVKDELRWKRFYLSLTDFGIDDKKMAEWMGEEFVVHSPKKTQLIQHSLELLSHLQGKYNMHIITNGFEEVQHIKMEVSGLKPYFDLIVTSEAAGALKPHAQIFDFALQNAKSNKQNSLMIGDSFQADILGAKNAGIDQVFYNPKSEKVDEKPTFEIKSLMELVEIL